MSRKQIIPMDEVVKEFELHLKSHPRTILSARFGDGKSTFLAASEKKLQGRYVFLTLFPVNYQVADNLDVFDLIKRDLLFQLYEKGLVQDSYEIPDDIASFFFLQNNWATFAEETLKFMSHFDSSNTIKATLGAAKFLKCIQRKYESFKANGGDIGDQLDRFITSFDNRKGIYEADPITTIICDIIKDWKSRNKRKKICLVFEDMDRIDPAHIFRILNVISAHMDYGYKYGASPMSNSLAGNKFGVDNIVVCLDYNNLANIFTHFYGSGSGFHGYINKFCDKGIFNYSLHELIHKYYSQRLMLATEMSVSAIETFTGLFDFQAYTLRDFCHALDDVDSQITLPQMKNNVVAHKGFYVMAAILRRLRCDDAKIIEILSQAFRMQTESVGPYIITSMILNDSKYVKGGDFSFGKKRDGYMERFAITDINSDGTVYIQTRIALGWNPQESYCKPEEVMAEMLKAVNK